jgi:hypothetical protein
MKRKGKAERRRRDEEDGVGPTHQQMYTRIKVSLHNL